MNRRIHGALLALAASSMLLACGNPEIAFRNDLPGATLENIRWLAEDASYQYGVQEPIQPGDTSPPVRLYLGDDNQSGPIAFELVVDGARVALHTTRAFEPADEEDLTTFIINAETQVQNPLLTPPPPEEQ